MSLFREALKTYLLAELRCPCGAADGMEVDLGLEAARCGHCGRYGPITAFKRRE